jgi:AraC family transcriptional regulator
VLGHKRSSRQLPGLLLTEVSYAVDVELVSHYHENAFFGLILRGTGSDVTARGTFLAGPATLVFHPAGERHANHWYEAGRCLVIELSSTLQDRLGGYHQRLSGGGIPSGPAVRTALEVFREFSHFDAVSPLALEGLVLELMAAVCRSVSPVDRGTPPDWLRRTQELLRDRLRENVSLAELSAVVGIHPGHIVRMFRKHCRCTPGDYVRCLRVEQASRELARGARPLAEIALSLGFSDQSHFSTVFKRHTGLTPAQFRKSHQRR